MLCQQSTATQTRVQSSDFSEGDPFFSSQDTFVGIRGLRDHDSGEQPAPSCSPVLLLLMMMVLGVGDLVSHSNFVNPETDTHKMRNNAPAVGRRDSQPLVRRRVSRMLLVVLSLIVLLLVLTPSWNVTTSNTHSSVKSQPITTTSVLHSSHNNNSTTSVPNTTTTTTTRGSWIGTHWIPPAGLKLYSVSQLQTIFRGHSILWLGDSTGRRTAMQLVSLLSSHHSNNPQNHNMDVWQVEQWIDVNGQARKPTCQRPWAQTAQYKDSTAYPKDTICRRISTIHTDVTFLRINCLSQLYDLLHAELHYSSSPTTTITTNTTTTKTTKDPRVGRGLIWPQYDLVVIALGVWHEELAHVCADHASQEPRLKSDPPYAEKFRNDVSISEWMHRCQDLIQALLLQQQSHRPVHVIWRTSGYSAHSLKPHPAHHVQIQAYNTALRTMIPSPWWWSTNHSTNSTSSTIAMVDWSAMIQGRSFGTTRLGGDMFVHYGWEPRFVLIQLLANRVQQLHDKQEDRRPPES